MSTGHSHLIFESILPAYQKRGEAKASPLFWYAGRDSNPQPSEPESDALSIEPPAHLLYSLDIIAVFSRFVKRETENIFPSLRAEARKVVVFYGFL